MARDLKTRLHVIHERDVGLFSLIQQVVAHVPWAKAEGRTPVAYFTDRCSYYVPGGYNSRDTVWEYYFEPMVAGVDASTIPDHVVQAVANEPLPSPFTHRLINPGDHLISREFGNRKRLRGKTLSIPFHWADPTPSFRSITAPLFDEYVRPRADLMAKVSAFADEKFGDNFVIGVHARGTDAVSSSETRAFRQNSLKLDNFVQGIEAVLVREPDAVVFIATDEQATLEHFTAALGDRVVSYDSIRHGDEDGEAAGLGPTGELMPAYIAGDPARAAQNGEEAVIEWLLLCRAHHLLHNGASLGRTVLLARPSLPHNNVHLDNLSFVDRYLPPFQERFRKIRKKIIRSR